MTRAPGDDDASILRVVDAWCARDHAGAFLAADHAVVDATRPLRGVVVAEALRVASGLPRAARAPAEVERPPVERDLLHALAAIGRAIAEGRGSPTLAAITVDNLLAALGPLRAGGRGDAALGPSARAAVFESFTHVLSATLRDQANRRWEYPACVVPLPDGSVAIAAGHPVDDEETLTLWASRVAHALSLAGVRRAVVSGSREAVAAVMDALELAGVAATERQARLGAKAERATR